MTIFKFECLKLYKNKFCWLYLIICGVFTVSFFLFNRHQLPKVKEQLSQQHQKIQHISQQKLDHFNYLEEIDEMTPTLEKEKKDVLTISSNSEQVLAAIENNKPRQFFEKKLIEIELIEQYNAQRPDEVTISRYPYVNNQVSQDKQLTTYLLTHQLGYEAPNIATSPPNFIYLLSQLLSGFWASFLLVFLINIPLMIEFNQKNIRFTILETRSNKAKAFMQYQLFKFMVFIACILLFYLFSSILTHLLGEGILGAMNTSYQYPVAIGDAQRLFTIQAVLLKNLLIILFNYFLINGCFDLWFQLKKILM